ncbi:MAG TPA: ATP-binding protein [Myxococcales bacterium]
MAATDDRSQPAGEGERAKLLMAERRQRLLSEVSRDLLDYVGSDVVEPLRRIVHKVVGELGDWCAFALVREDEKLEQVAVWHPDPVQRAIGDKLNALVPPRRWDENPERNALVQKRTIVVEQITEEMLKTSLPSPELLDLYLQLGMTSVLIAPMFDAAKPLGQLVLVGTRSGGRRYTEDDADFAFSLAGRAALAVRNARLVGLIADERDRHRAAREDAEARAAELFAVLDAGPNGIVLFDVDGRLRVASRQMEELFGARWAELSGQTFEEVGLHLAPCFDQPRGPMLDRIREVFRDRTARTVDEIEVIFPRKRTLVRATAPVVSAAGAYLGRIFSYADVTEARALDRQRSDFLTVAAHEMRTPLTPLLMYLQTIERRALQNQPVDLDVVGKARRQVTRISRLVEDLLDLSRLESRRAQLSFARVALGEVVEQVVADARAQTRNHEIVYQPAARELAVMGDRARLEQVLVNLLQNAVKYSPEGGRIAVRAERRSGEARVSVQDPGIGIPADEQKRLFQRFFRAGNASARNFGGLGIGLFVSHEIVVQHGGRFEVESEVGKGSTFTFSLPLAGEPRDGPKRVILLVDDDPEILEATGQVLREWGYSVEEARDGAAALERVQHKRPDLMLIDLMMPVMDGWALIGKLREEKLAEGVPIAVFSADREARSKADELKADASLRKPFELDELQELVERLLS